MLRNAQNTAAATNATGAAICAIMLGSALPVVDRLLA